MAEVSEQSNSINTVKTKVRYDTVRYTEQVLYHLYKRYDALCEKWISICAHIYTAIAMTEDTVETFLSI